MDEIQKKHQAIFEQFLDGLITWQVFPDKEEDKRDQKKRWQLTKVIHGNLVHAGKTLNYLNSRGAGVYATVNETDGKGRKAENITRVRAVFVDLDGASVTPVLDDLPDLVVETSPGKYHAYFKIADCPLAGFKQLQQSIAHKYDGDPKVVDLPRVMRVPGFYHHKGHAHMSQVVFQYNQPPITFAEAVEKWPPVPRKRFSAPRYAPSHQGDFSGQYGAVNGQRNDHVMRRLCGALSRGVSGNDLWQEALKEGYACDPPLHESEIEAIFKSVQRYGG